jgi:hypothetical protein
MSDEPEVLSPFVRHGRNFGGRPVRDSGQWVSESERILMELRRAVKDGDGGYGKQAHTMTIQGLCGTIGPDKITPGRVVKLVDTPALGAGSARSESSSLSPPTSKMFRFWRNVLY